MDYPAPPTNSKFGSTPKLISTGCAIKIECAEWKHRDAPPKHTKCDPLLMRLCAESAPYSSLDQIEELLDVGEGRLGIIIEIFQPVLVMIPFGEYFVDCKPRLLHCRASVLETVSYFFSCLLQRTVKAVGLLRYRTLPLSARFHLTGEFRISEARCTMRISASLTGDFTSEGPLNLEFWALSNPQSAIAPSKVLLTTF